MDFGSLDLVDMVTMCLYEYLAQFNQLLSLNVWTKLGPFFGSDLVSVYSHRLDCNRRL